MKHLHLSPAPLTHRHVIALHNEHVHAENRIRNQEADRANCTRQLRKLGHGSQFLAIRNATPRRRHQQQGVDEDKHNLQSIRLILHQHDIHADTKRVNDATEDDTKWPEAKAPDEKDLSDSEGQHTNFEFVDVQEQVTETGEDESENEADFEVGIRFQIAKALCQEHEQDEAINRETFNHR